MKRLQEEIELVKSKVKEVAPDSNPGRLDGGGWRSVFSAHLAAYEASW